MSGRERNGLGDVALTSRKDLRIVPSHGNGEGVAPIDWMIRKLASIGEISEDDQAAIRALPATTRDLDAYEDIVREGDQPDSVCLIGRGLIARYKILSDGERQIMSFHVAGDVPDLMSLFIERMDHSLCTLTPAVVVHLPHAVMLRLFQEHPSVGFLFWRATVIEAAIFREWMVGLGRRSAYTRLAHMLCEVMMQMRAVGLAQGNTCHLPLTQAEIADATGMSTVHVNRTLQELRRNGLITFQGGSLDVLDWEALQKAGDFDPNYLHIYSRG